MVAKLVFLKRHLTSCSSRVSVLNVYWGGGRLGGGRADAGSMISNQTTC